MLAKKNHFVDDTVFPFVASFIDKSTEFEASCDLTRVTAQYTGVVIKVLLDHKQVRWGENELSKLQSESAEFEQDARGVTGPRFSSGFHNLKLRNLDHLLEGSERFGFMSFTNAAPFEHPVVLDRQSFIIPSQKLSKRVQKTAQNMMSAIYRVQGTESRVERSGCEAAGPTKRQRLEQKRGYLAQDTICLSLERTTMAADTRGTVLLLKT